MAEQGVTHLVKCVCVLPQMSKLPNPPSHEFKVFSILSEESSLEPTFVQCDNCGVIHKVTDVCVSSILRGRDEASSLVTLADVRPSIPKELALVLEQHRADLPTWQRVAWVVERAHWGEHVVLTSEYIDGTRQGKVMTIMGASIYKISNFTNETTAG